MRRRNTEEKEGAMKEPFKLVHDTISHDTIEALKTLLSEAIAGNLIGIAFTAMYKQGNFKVNTAGESHKSTTFAIGTVVVLLYKLVCKVVGK